jgi:hypothetical protein
VVPSALAQLSAVLGPTDINADQLRTAESGTPARTVLG